MIHFFIPKLPKTPNVVLSKHWRVRSRESQMWHALVAKAVKNFNGDLWNLKKAKLTLTRYSTSEPDFDGLVGSFKYVIDGLVEAGVIIDDKYSVIGESKYKWERSKRNGQGIEVIVEAA